MVGEQDGGGTRDQALGRLLQPAAVAIVGMSAKPNTAGHLVLRNLRMNEFAGDIHLIGRSGGEVDGLSIRTDMADLPEGVDVAVLTVPAAAVGEALAACAARKIGSAVVFASGFAEVGDAARQEQDRLGQLARDSGMVVIGPNCIGYTNYRAGFTVGFVSVNAVQRIAADTTDAVAIIAQSGGLGNHLRLGLTSRGIAVSYNISTGNEMDLGLGDFVRRMLNDAATRVIMIYAEHIRQPEAFLAAANQARAVGKAVVLMHPGRGARAKEAAKSHTGALAGDYAVMRVMAERAGVVMVDTLDELLDTAEILAGYPRISTGGLGVLTFSGAFCGIAHDFCDDLGLAIPPLSAETEARLKPEFPAFLPPKNPLDLGTEAVWRPELVGIGLSTLLAEPAIGGVVISIPIVSPKLAQIFLENVIAACGDLHKPVVFSILGDGTPLQPEFTAVARENKIVLSRSADRAIRAMAHVLGRTAPPVVAERSRVATVLPRMPAPGLQPEWVGKLILASVGIPVPSGSLVVDVEQAASAAGAIGYPVVLKAQSAALAHKTEAGGVVLNLGDEAALRAGWAALMANIERAKPGLRLDGVLVEAMSPRGLELVVGGRRDPQWGPVLLIGLGGILVEALGDVRLLPPDASEAEIIEAFGKLKSARLLYGFRNQPAVDLPAAARVARAVGQLFLDHPEIIEIDVNPLMVFAEGQGAVALDALIVTANASGGTDVG
jgi:acyl-CoA synthetase (NDP forming)